MIPMSNGGVNADSEAATRKRWIVRVATGASVIALTLGVGMFVFGVSGFRASAGTPEFNTTDQPTWEASIGLNPPDRRIAAEGAGLVVLGFIGLWRRWE